MRRTSPWLNDAVYCCSVSSRLTQLRWYNCSSAGLTRYESVATVVHNCYSDNNDSCVQLIALYVLSSCWYPWPWVPGEVLGYIQAQDSELHAAIYTAQVQSKPEGTKHTLLRRSSKSPTSTAFFNLSSPCLGPIQPQNILSERPFLCSIVAFGHKSSETAEKPLWTLTFCNARTFTFLQATNSCHHPSSRED